jgi:hypothetical protein
MDDRTNLILTELKTTKLRLMGVQDAINELQLLIWATKEETYPNPPVEDEEFTKIISTALTLVGQEPEIGTSWSQVLGSRERQMLGVQAQRVVRALEHNHLYQLQEGLAQYVLVPHNWVSRMELMLGHCTAPLVTVQLPDALQ